MCSKCNVAFLFALLLLPCHRARTEDQFFDSNGVKLRYVVEGSGEPVLLIHGFSVNLDRQWRAPGVLAAIAKDHQVIAYDNRGHGKSDKPHDPEKYGLEMVEDAVRLMDHLQVKKAHVVGYSMGAMITNKLLAAHPERLLSATLGGSAGRLEGGDTTWDDDFAADLESGKGVKRLLDVLTPAGQPKPTEAELQQINAGFYLGNDGKALAAVARGWRKLAVAEAQIKANRLPVLALIGSQDPLKIRVDEMAGVLKGMSTVVIEGANHMNAPGRPEFASELRGFLEKYKSN
jgi:pimeloyl-ACP methyl ester carboxylesterase